MRNKRVMRESNLSKRESIQPWKSCFCLEMLNSDPKKGPLLEGEPWQRAGRNIVDKVIVEYMVRTNYCMYKMWELMSWYGLLRGPSPTPILSYPIQHHEFEIVGISSCHEPTIRNCTLISVPHSHQFPRTDSFRCFVCPLVLCTN